MRSVHVEGRLATNRRLLAGSRGRLSASPLLWIVGFVNNSQASWLQNTSKSYHFAVMARHGGHEPFLAFRANLTTCNVVSPSCGSTRSI